MYVFVVNIPVSRRITVSVGAVVATVVATIVVGIAVVGSVVSVGGAVVTVVGTVVWAGVPIFIEQPAIQTVAIRNTATNKMVIFVDMVDPAFFFIQIIVMESPALGDMVTESLKKVFSKSG